MRYYKNGNIQKFPMECKKREWQHWALSHVLRMAFILKGKYLCKTLKHVWVLTDLGKSICSLVDGYTVTWVDLFFLDSF